MSRFYLNIRNGTGYTPDEEGVEVAGPDDVRPMAIQGARSILSEELLAGEIDLSGQIEVTDEEGAIVMIVPFAEVVAVRMGSHSA